MLQLRDIVKTYVTGEMRQVALKGVSVNFRDNEFVSILGHSGSGKTTLLNIVGGLDRYDSGDLIINGVSTQKYREADWDIYRNHRIGFVFQSYNLIPHQSVLANVEMAMTLSGVSKKERRERAVAILKKVGLADHIHKRPNQMSGGQMQRVAIARALVNNPDILLADEPTGALDSDTSVQIMELLKEIAKDKLVVMVTHNPELAEKYSTRIVKLKDGAIVSDTNPYLECDEPAEPKKQKRVSMSFLTALSLSFNNLRTKKGRTILTAFAGSIGIIGIALILALSTGMNAYISNIQKETMTAYPITIESKTFDMSSLLDLREELADDAREDDRNAVYANYQKLTANETVASGMKQNNLTAFKKYLENPDSEIRNYLGENGAIYSYDVAFHVYSYDEEGRFVDSDSDPEKKDYDISASAGGSLGAAGNFGGMMAEEKYAYNFSELMVGANGNPISQVVTDSYDLLYGNWPAKYDEVVLVLDNKNSVSADKLCQLGLITNARYQEAVEAVKKGEDPREVIFDYAKVCEHSFYLVPECDLYRQKENGTYAYLEDIPLNKDVLLENAVEIKITGIVRPAEDASNAEIQTAIAYTSALTDYIIAHTAESLVVEAQNETPELNVLNGLKFEAATDEEKVAMTAEYLSGLGVSEKSSLYKLILYYSAGSGAEDGEDTDSDVSGQEGAADSDVAIPGDAMPDGAGGAGMLTGGAGAAGFAGSMGAGAMDDAALAAMFDKWLQNDPDQKIMLELYDQYIGEASYEGNLKKFGNVSYDTPSSISLYADNFEDKENLADCIKKYNAGVEEDSKISYTDYVAMMTSSLTTIINGISYVLIAFVAISLVVSSIMIGIITHISVMERTKEIGILRALGASKGNISQVFNAETFIIGCFSGLVGIGVTLLLLIPINAIIKAVSGLEDLAARLPISSSIVLIVISIVITMIGGLIPASKASAKDPVIALRTE